jgi:hypothetical protein
VYLLIKALNAGSLDGNTLISLLCNEGKSFSNEDKKNFALSLLGLQSLVDVIYCKSFAFTLYSQFLPASNAFDICSCLAT